jgi:TonB-linked SusC/RagA family outer membrane protein
MKFKPLLLKIMKFSCFGFVLQTILMGLLFAHDGNAQRQQLSVKEVFVRVNLTEAALTEVFKAIEKQTSFVFNYDDRVINSNSSRISINGRRSVADILLHVSETAKVKFKQVNNNISIENVHDDNGQDNMLEIIIQTRNITGRVTSQDDGEGIPGVNVIERGTSNGTITDIEGRYSLDVSEGAFLTFSSVGFMPYEVEVGNQSVISIQMIQDVRQLDEIVVVGYGVQKRSDITGTVASLGQERLEMVPNLNVAQAIQGAIPGVMIQTTSAGAASNEAILIRGRNSIEASNSPLIVVDGIQYQGNLRDININDIKTIDILKDASAAAIYGSRGSNGVILITTKEGTTGDPKITYEGYYSIQDYVNLPDIMDGEQFYNFKLKRVPAWMTLSEKAIYESGEWVNWVDLGLRKGNSQQHNISLAGGLGKTTYYLSGSLLDVHGLARNDDYQRWLGRINVTSKVKDWLSIGTRTQISYEDRSGQPPSLSGLFWMNPLTVPYDENGNLSVYPWAEDPHFANPLQNILFDDTNNSYQILSNNFVEIDFPFIKGLNYRFNSGIRRSFGYQATYRGVNTSDGILVRGRSDTQQSFIDNNVIENILSYNRGFGNHNIFLTGVIGYEDYKFKGNSLRAQAFPNDILTFYAAQQAELLIPNYNYNSTALISQMIRLNYSYDSRYLFTFTTRRDGFSGFGTDTKWGLFPSVAIGWNMTNEDFFPWKDIFSELKLRTSYGMNGNQAVSPFQSMARLGSSNIVDEGVTQPGFEPSRLGQETLGWESSTTFNVGLDYGILQDRITGDINIFFTNTNDLLLNRSISSVHGITSIIQNIGKTKNTGVEFSVRSRNIVTEKFRWFTSGNTTLVKNQIVDLYGDGTDDAANSWFIGHPIWVNYDFVVDGVWQLNEEEEAISWGSKPGYVKLKDVNGDNILSGEDRQIIGQRDPKVLWGMTNSFSYTNFSLDIFIHGVHGITRLNDLKTDLETYSTIRRNTIKKNWWTPDNPTNEYVMNHLEAENMSGIRARWYEDASFVRIKDISLSYEFSERLTERIGAGRLRIYTTARNLFTFTKWGALDPELSNQTAIPLQKEFVFGLNLNF